MQGRLGTKLQADGHTGDRRLCRQAAGEAVLHIAMVEPQQLRVDALRLEKGGWVVEQADDAPVSYTHLRAHETALDLVCRLLLEKKNYNLLNID